MDLKTYLLPYIISNLLGLGLFILGWKKPGIGRVVFSIIFLAAGIFNMYTAQTTPEIYTIYAEGAVLGIYQSFIKGTFAGHARLFVSLIAVGQMLVALLLLPRNKTARTLGVFGGILFFLAISPLGTGSAFPAPLLMAAGLFLCHDRFRKK